MKLIVLKTLGTKTFMSCNVFCRLQDFSQLCSATFPKVHRQNRNCKFKIPCRHFVLNQIPRRKSIYYKIKRIKSKYHSLTALNSIF